MLEMGKKRKKNKDSYMIVLMSFWQIIISFLLVGRLTLNGRSEGCWLVDRSLIIS